MPGTASNGLSPSFDFLHLDKKHYRDFRRRNFIRLIFTYLAPLILISVYFYFQHGVMISEGRQLRLKAIAENQSNMFDLFLTERLNNLRNIVNDPRLESRPTQVQIDSYLGRLKNSSETFVDLGYFDETGVQKIYSGPYPSLEKIDYSNESWYISLIDGNDDFIITDIYLGFRQKPHFTIAVRKNTNDEFTVLRATLDPGKIYEYIRSLEGANEVISYIVNQEGYYQIVTSHLGTALETSSIVPPRDVRLGIENIELNDKSITFAYSWLQNADWALIVQQADDAVSFFSGSGIRIISVSAIFIIISLIIICVRTQKLVEIQIESDKTKAQLEHAAKLASVGELAAGIAHEINNPLAAINEEAGLMKDLLSPEYGNPVQCKEIIPHLDSIHDLVFRCRDITRKLMGFVRKTDFDIKKHNINKLIDEVVDGLFSHEMMVSNIELVKNYSNDIPELKTDGHQLQQVFLNVINNAVDAIENRRGTITISTSKNEKSIEIKISDSGKGIEPDSMGKIFMPFYTTKEVGKGTGLGLSVSYGIIKNLGGKIEVKSEMGKGTTFTLKLPLI